MRHLVLVSLCVVVGCSSPTPSSSVESAKTQSALNGVATLDALFISSKGWVPPGATYPFRVVYSAGAAGITTGTIKVTLPSSAYFVSAVPAPASGNGSSGSPLTWSVGPLAADAKGQIIITARAATLTEDPQVIWKNLSASATLDFTAGLQQQSLSSKTNGPRVTTLSTARYGDRPFPMLNVEYQDIKHCTGSGTPYPECTAAHSGQGLDDAVNSKTSGKSFWQLYQEISFGQLNPMGRVPAASQTAATFSGVAQHRFSTLQPKGTCTGTTLAGSDGTPLYANRIANGWYQLPGTQAYYGSDTTGHALAGALTGQGLLFGIDDACGPTGKLVYDAASLADDDLDFNDFDSDRDGVVDFTMVVFAGQGGNGNTGTTGVNNVWPHSSDLRYYFTDSNGVTGYVTNDQLRDLQERPLWYTDTTRSAYTTTNMGDALKAYVRVGPYNVNPEYAIDAVSVIGHEYGHSLGLPDFYSTGSRTTFGAWELMGEDHSQFMTSFSRQDLGWIVPRPMTDGTITLKESKIDTHEIAWTQPDGGSYTLTGSDVHNADVYRVPLEAVKLISSVPSGTHAWHSGAGNDFGCPTDKGHGLLVRLPELAQHTSATGLKLSFKSHYEMEWDYDYGFVLVSKDGGKTWASVASSKNTTISGYNPNNNACLTTWGNGITGVSGDANTATNTDRATSTYPAPQWIDDEFDLSSYAGSSELLILLSYATDPGLAKKGWFVDDLKVTATENGSPITLYASDFESGQESSRLFPLGASGWGWISSDQGLAADHAYYVELRDRVSFDYDGKGQADRGPVAWEPGVSIIYTNEAHGYGNFGVDDPPAQTPVDSTPTPGSETPNLDDAAFTAAAGRNTFDACSHIDNYTDPDGPNGNWKLPPGVKLVVSALSGLSTSGTAPSSAIATLNVDVNPDCNVKPPEPPVLSFGADRQDPDPDGQYTLEWTRPQGAVGPDLLEETRTLTSLFSDDAENGLTQWNATTTGTGQLAWTTSTAKTHSPSNAFWAHALDGTTDADNILELKTPIAVPSSGTTSLTFWDFYLAEGDDEARVEVKDGNSWEAVATFNRSALANDAAATFATESMSKHSIDLAAKYAGKTIGLRFVFRCGAENRAGSNPTIGWYVDDISVETADWQDVVTTTSTSYLRGGRTAGTYYYRVRTQYPFGSAITIPSPWSNVISTVVGPNNNVDSDDDGVVDAQDNCPSAKNPLQENADGDALGDACDACPQDASNDADDDGVCGAVDNCPTQPNPDQLDADADGVGDVCDLCPNDSAGDGDGDGICSASDNCPSTPNTDQVDSDGDGKGDACDDAQSCPNGSNKPACTTNKADSGDVQLRGSGCTAVPGLSLVAMLAFAGFLRRRARR